MQITALYTYPIKSCGALSHQQIALVERGLRDDRRWMVITDDGKLVTQRDVSKLALVQPVYTETGLTITAPGMSTISIPAVVEDAPTRSVFVFQDTCAAVDQGAEIAAWLSDFLGVEVRLVRIAETDTRSTSTIPPAPVSFVDEYPILLANEHSLADLNERLLAREKATVPITRFRPNVIIDGTAAWQEDEWTQISIGGVTFTSVSGCARCVMTSVDQPTGTVPDHKEPLATLATFRKAPTGGILFGQNIIHQTLGDLHVGDEVVVRG